MHGPEDLGKRATAWLEGRIPARLRIIEQRQQLAPHTIADPAQVLDHERGPIGIEDWPSVFVLPQDLTRSRLVDVEDGGAEQYLNTYRMQVLGWVRADDYDTTSRLRLRYALAIREALLERKSLTLATGVVLGNPHADLSVDPNSIRESYSPVITDDAARTIAGVETTVDVTVREALEPPPPFGSVNYPAGVTVVPAHPALD